MAWRALLIAGCLVLLATDLAAAQGIRRDVVLKPELERGEKLQAGGWRQIGTLKGGRELVFTLPFDLAKGRVRIRAEVTEHLSGGQLNVTLVDGDGEEAVSLTQAGRGTSEVRSATVVHPNGCKIDISAHDVRWRVRVYEYVGGE